jgi:hypothetical protein
LEDSRRSRLLIVGDVPMGGGALWKVVEKLYAFVFFVTEGAWLWIKSTLDGVTQSSARLIFSWSWLNG